MANKTLKSMPSLSLKKILLLKYNFRTNNYDNKKSSKKIGNFLKVNKDLN